VWHIYKIREVLSFVDWFTLTIAPPSAAHTNLGKLTLDCLIASCFTARRAVHTWEFCLWLARNGRQLKLHKLFVLSGRIVGPTFFNEIINCERYVHVILRQFFPELTQKEKLFGWFQQDSTTAHTACMSMQVLSDVFGDRIISSGIWPACSSNLNPCGIFFWGCLKDKVYNSNPWTKELKENICSKIANIPAEWLQRANQNLFHWCKECLWRQWKEKGRE
jgi:hypothetical protein